MAEALLSTGGLGEVSTTGTSELHLTENAERVLQARYLKKDEHGRCVETPVDLFRRVAKSIAAAELIFDTDPERRSEWEGRFYSLMASRRFMPNSPTLMNAGRDMGMLSACFVLPVGDSINEIFDSIKHTALIQKAGGGTGFAFDQLRPTGDYIRSSGGTTSGPISFWRAFSEATNAIQQGAFRRGANMGMMYIHHPDILKFLHAKEDLSQFTNYNISVKVTDEWMDAFLAKPDSPHAVHNPRTGKYYVMPRSLKVWEYDIRSLVATDSADATPEGDYITRREIWETIVGNAHRTGEPGVVFIDRINEHNPTPHVGRIEATNPCGEQPLLPYEACNLGSINVAAFVGRSQRGVPTVDWESLRETIHDSVRFLDNVVEVNNYPIPEIEAVCRGNRKIGLGVMGFADALYRLEVPYNSEEGIGWGGEFMKFINDEAHEASAALAAERGVFPNWEGSIWDTNHQRPMRNAACTTVAPTGTISIIAGCSGGIEPLFSLAFIRNVLRGQDEGKTPMIEVNPIFEAVARERNILCEGLMERVATDGTLAGIPEIPEDVKRTYVCAHDITPEWHVRMQAAFQEHCDSSISKTINFAHEAKIEDVDSIYQMAYELKCKGITVYRDGCREMQPMALKDSGKKSDGQAAEGRTSTETIADSALRPDRPLEPAMLPEITSGIRIRQLTPFGNMHINLTVDPRTERELEVFAQLGKGGDLANSDLEAICRMVSLWLRAGGRLDTVIRQLHGIGSSLQVPTKEGRIMSLGDGLARSLQKYRRAKAQFGLRALLMGDYSIDALSSGTSVTKESSPSGGGNGRGGKNGNSSKASGRGSSTGSSGSASLGLRQSSGQLQQDLYKVRCPDCRSVLHFSEGCVRCESCGYSGC
jgi:ribonucleoside-diphosphate reductase alpha chain